MIITWDIAESVSSREKRSENKTHEGMQCQETRLNPWPLPVESPSYGGEENGRLNQMLDKDSSPIVLNPVVLQCDSEWNADPGAQDEQSIAPRQRDRIP